MVPTTRVLRLFAFVHDQVLRTHNLPYLCGAQASARSHRDARRRRRWRRRSRRTWWIRRRLERRRIGRRRVGRLGRRPRERTSWIRRRLGRRRLRRRRWGRIWRRQKLGLEDSRRPDRGLHRAHEPRSDWALGSAIVLAVKSRWTSPPPRRAQHRIRQTGREPTLVQGVRGTSGMIAALTVCSSHRA